MFSSITLLLVVVLTFSVHAITLPREIKTQISGPMIRFLGSVSGVGISNI